MSNDPLPSEHRRPVADERSIVDWLSADDDIDLVPERLNILLQDLRGMREPKGRPAGNP